MPNDDIVSLLIAQRDKVNRAIEALQGQVKRRGRPPKNPLLNNRGTDGAPLKRRHHLSAAARRKMSLAQKKRWAAVRAARE